MDGDAARRPQYTAAQREEALRLYVDVGPAKASRECNIPAATIRSWAHRKGIAAAVPPSEHTKAATDAARLSWAQRRLELAGKTGAAAADLLERIRAARKPTDVRALATAYATLVEKGSAPRRRGDRARRGLRSRPPRARQGDPRRPSHAPRAKTG